MKNLLYVFCAMAVLAGCAKDRDLDPVANVSEASKDRDLQKTFNSPCTVAGAEVLQTLGTVKGEKTVFRFDGNNITRESRYYAAADCSGEPAFTMQENGTFRIETDRNKDTNDRGRNIDINWKTVKVAINTDDGVKAANSDVAPLCGLKDWKKGGEARDVTAQAKNPTCYNGKVPRQDWNIYRVDAGTLYLGRVSKSENAQKDRPAKLESTKYTSN